MIRVEEQCRWEGDLYGSWDGGAKPLWEGSKRRGIPPIPPLFEGSNGGDGKARDPEYLPVLPEEIYLMIAREYRLARVEDRDANGWWQVRMEMNYLPRCPKRKRIINIKGFYVPRHGNQLEPVTGYFYRRLIRRMFATEDRDPRLYRWFRATFGRDDYLRPGQACEWPFIHCRYCGESHECGNEEEEE